MSSDESIIEREGGSGSGDGENEGGINLILKIAGDLKMELEDFHGGAVVKNPPANAGDTGSSPGPGRSHMPQSN